MLEVISPEVFFLEQEKIEHITFTQSKGFYHFQKTNGTQLVCIQNSETNPSIQCFGTLYKVPFSSKKILRIEGDSIKNTVSEKEIIDFYSALFSKEYIGIEYNGEKHYSPELEIALRRSGFVRPLGMFSCPLTIELNLKTELKYNRNWKRNIKKGIEHNLTFEIVSKVERKHFERFIEMFNEMAQLKGLNYTLSLESLLAMFENDNDFKLFFAYQNNQPVASRIVHLRNGIATDVFAANSNEARNSGATFFIMDQIFNYLKDQGVAKFDFARIPPSNHASDSVYQFKIGSGGEVKQYMGEWVLYNNKYIELLMTMYKVFKVKKQRY